MLFILEFVTDSQYFTAFGHQERWHPSDGEILPWSFLLFSLTQSVTAGVLHWPKPCNMGETNPITLLQPSCSADLYHCTHALGSCSCIRHTIQPSQWASMALTKHMGSEFIAHSKTKQNKTKKQPHTVKSIFIVISVERLASLVQIHCTHRHCFWKTWSKKPKGSQIPYCSHIFCTGFARPSLPNGNRRPLNMHLHL